MPDKKRVKKEPAPVGSQKRKWCKLAIIGFIIPIAGFFISPFFLFGPINMYYRLRLIFSGVFEIGGSMVGFVLSIVSLRRIKKNKYLKGRWFSIAGLIVPLVIIVPWIMLFVNPWVVISVDYFDGCMFDTGIACIDFAVFKDTGAGDGAIKAKLMHYLEYPIVLTNVQAAVTGDGGACSACDESNNYCNMTNPSLWDGYEQKMFVLPCPGLEHNREIGVSIEITYHQQGSSQDTTAAGKIYIS